MLGNYPRVLIILIPLLYDLIISTAVYADEKKVALVIGNSAYSVAPLKNPVNDATDISHSLQQLGFEVINGTDLNRKQLRQHIREFGSLLKKADVGFFYFAGHGIQFDGENYLIPVSTDMQSEDEVVDEAISVSTVLNKMEGAGNAINIVVLDACRNNPFERSFRSATRGLTRLDGPTGSYIAYATAPGKIASDGSGKNGLYTQYLLQYMQEPGLGIEQVFKKVRIEVIADTAGKQIPWENSSLLGDFYFLKKDQQENLNDPINYELRFWKSADKSASRSFYQAYLEKYPNGHFSDLAESKIKQLKLTSEKNTKKAKEKEDTKVLSSLNLSNVKHFVKAKTEVEEIVNENFFDMEFIKISAGCFSMGSTFAEEGRLQDELLHEVCISKDYWLGKYEVTQAQWQKIMGKNPSYFRGCGANCPVEMISWNDVQTFIFRLNDKTGFNYRLPTEAEWEFAARAGNNTAVYSGNPEWVGANNVPELNPIAWYSGNSGVDYKGGKYCEDWDDKQLDAFRCGTHSVGLKRANHWGFYDMIGNVWEWTNDRYGSYSSEQKNDPKGSRKGVMRVSRGGNWADSLEQNRAAARYGFGVRSKQSNLGFRLAR